MNARNVAFVAGLVAVALVVGFGAGLAVIRVVGAVLPFQPSDDDTLREFIPVALAYLAWGATSLIIIVLGWRRLRGLR
jgi:hypothetical protein